MMTTTSGRSPLGRRSLGQDPGGRDPDGQDLGGRGPRRRGPLRRELNLRRASACFLAAYVIVTVLAAVTTLVYASVADTKAADELATSPVLAPSFATTVPYHVLIMLVVWPLFSVVYFRRAAGRDAGRPSEGTDRWGRGGRLRETAVLSAVWVLAAVVVDLVGFVVIRNPWSLTPHQFYVDYQPWITLIYASILASPWIPLLATPRHPRSRGL